jgi:tetratricopeptide (TPR) repeat protein
MIRRPEWQRELDPELYVALTRNQLPGALGMNSAFTHAEGELDVTVAYYAASQMLAFTAEQYGFSKIARALDLWGHGVTTLDVIPRAFGVTAPEYDARFRAWALSRLSRYANQYMFDSHRVAVDDARSAVGADPSNPTPHVRYALALVQSRQLDDARREVDLALKIDPGNRDAHYLDAKLATDAGDFEGATRHLRAIQASGIDGYMVEMALANAAEGAHNTAGRRMALEAATLLDPTQVEPLRALFDLANQEKRDADALTALRAVARLDQHDRQAWRMLLDRLVQHRLWDEAKRIGESALYVDVASGPIHSLYAQALAATGDHVGAAFELESALLCDGRPDERATLHARLARERFALGEASAARVHRDEALRLDPANAEARSLKP